jgi:hypothetical protein
MAGVVLYGSELLNPKEVTDHAMKFAWHQLWMLIGGFLSFHLILYIFSGAGL